MDKDVVLVIGAGASVPYKMPTGSQLNELARSGTLPMCRAFMDMNARFGMDIAGEFRHRFTQANPPSIDSFLEHNQELEEYGKFFIAHSIFDKELNALLSMPHDWIQKILHFPRMSTGLSSGKVKIITFNYDRLFEISFYKYWSNFRRTSHLESVDKVRNLQLVHVYGSLSYKEDKIWGLQQDGVSLTKNALGEYAFSCSEGIRVMTEARAAHDSDLVVCRKWLQEANQVCFLGFGYDEINMERIGCKGIGRQTHRSVLGTGIGIKSSHRQRIDHFLGTSTGAIDHQGFFCNDYIDEYLRSEWY